MGSNFFTCPRYRKGNKFKKYKFPERDTYKKFIPSTREFDDEEDNLEEYMIGNREE